MYITNSLGWNEARDIGNVIRFLKRKYGIEKFILWGRSMGAVAALLYLSSKNTSNHAIAGIFDSPFSNLTELVEATADKWTIIPGFVVDVFID